MCFWCCGVYRVLCKCVTHIWIFICVCVCECCVDKLKSNANYGLISDAKHTRWRKIVFFCTESN